MSLKKKLGMGIATAVMGVGLIGGGVFAYFSDTAEQTNTFASGTIDLSVDPEVQVPMDNLKPGDWMPRSFDLVNGGSLDIAYVDLNTEYTVTRDGEPVTNNLAEEYANQLYVEFLYNTTGDDDYEVLFEVSLHELSGMTPEDLATRVETELTKVRDGGCFLWWCWDPEYEENDVEVTGIAQGETANFDVQFRFNETGEDQNVLQNLDLELNWTFEGFQGEGEEK